MPCNHRGSRLLTRICMATKGSQASDLEIRVCMATKGFQSTDKYSGLAEFVSIQLTNGRRFFCQYSCSTMLWLEAKSVQEKLVRSGFARQPQEFQAFDKHLHGNQGFQASDKGSAWQPRGSLQHIRTIRAREGQNRKCGS